MTKIDTEELYAFNKLLKESKEGVDQKIKQSNHAIAGFSKEDKLTGGAWSSAKNHFDKGYTPIQVQYNYKGELRTGYVKFMKNSSLINPEGVPIKSFAKFEFVGTNSFGEITTYHIESKKTFWKMLNNGENIKIINPIE